MTQIQSLTDRLLRILISAMLIVAGIIHVLPLSGVLGSAQLAALYGVVFTEQNIEILMRHRAVLFGMLGTFFFLAAFRPKFQPVAFLAGFLSVLSFLWLAWSVGGYNMQIGRVFLADIVALVCLSIGAAALAYLRKTNR